jgi:hypothetical protein
MFPAAPSCGHVNRSCAAIPQKSALFTVFPLKQGKEGSRGEFVMGSMDNAQRAVILPNKWLSMHVWFKSRLVFPGCEVRLHRLTWPEPAVGMTSLGRG